MNIDIIICIASGIAYICTIIFNVIRIRRAKKALDKNVPLPLTSKSFKGIFVFSALLLILPLLIPLQTYVTALCCACAVLGAYLAMKDRIEQIKNCTKEQK